MSTTLTAEIMRELERGAVRDLRGIYCSVPSQTSVTGKFHWRVHCVDQSACGRFIKVAGHWAFGKPRWIKVSDVADFWRNPIPQ